MSGFQNLKIGTKIAYAIIIFLFPLFLLGYFIVAEKQELINFTKQEIAGVHYLKAAHQALGAIVSPPDKAALLKAADALGEAEAMDAGALGVTQKSNELAAALKNAAEGKPATGMADKATDLITAISDDSNITLDPDGDAYFIGDIIVNQGTGVLVQANSLLLAARNVDVYPGDDHKIAYAEAHDGMVASASNVASDLGKAIKNNADGSLQSALEADGRQIAAATARLSAVAKTLDRNALNAAATELRQKMIAFIVKNNEQMERLLHVRNAGFYKTLATRLGIALAAVLAGSFIFFIIIRSITRPISQVTSLMGKLTQGELEIEIPQSARRDEIGTLITSLQAFHVAAIEREQARKLEEERNEKEKARAVIVQKHTAAFEAKVQGIVNTISSASTELAYTAEEVTKVMEKNSENARNAAGSSVQTNSNVQSVASAAEEMSASVKEISSQVQRTNQLANDSRNKTAAADEKATILSEAAQKVSEAVTLIASIAGQINLLALNATIESARAGDAGKGFAVVASEVKNLANQTNKSVEDVSKVIEEVNAASSSIIAALRSIKESVENVSNASTNIAAAVEEQAVTTNEITRNMHSAAESTQVISQSLDSVSESSAHALSSATQVLAAAQELSRQSEELSREVGEFIQSIRAA